MRKRVAFVNGIAGTREVGGILSHIVIGLKIACDLARSVVRHERAGWMKVKLAIIAFHALDGREALAGMSNLIPLAPGIVMGAFKPKAFGARGQRGAA